MIAAAYLCRDAGLFYQQVAAVRAYVGQAAQVAGLVARHQQRLVQQTRQQFAGRKRTRCSDISEIAKPLPGARKNAFPCQRIGGNIVIKTCVHGRRGGDIGIDCVSVFHRQRCVNSATMINRKKYGRMK